jgi:hypothetical protein
VKNTIKNNVYSCENLDAKRYHLKTTKRGQKSYRVQLMFLGGLKIWPKGETCLDVMFLVQKSFGTAVAAEHGITSSGGKASNISGKVSQHVIQTRRVGLIIFRLSSSIE